MKKSFPHKKVWFWVILAAFFLLLGTVCVLAEDIGGLIALAMAVLLLSIFHSKRAGEKLRDRVEPTTEPCVRRRLRLSYR